MQEETKVVLAEQNVANIPNAILSNPELKLSDQFREGTTLPFISYAEQDEFPIALAAGLSEGAYRAGLDSYFYSKKRFKDDRTAYAIGYAAGIAAMNRRVDKELFNEEIIPEKHREPELLDRTTDMPELESHQGLQVQEALREIEWSVAVAKPKNFKGAIRKELSTNDINLARLCTTLSKKSPYLKTELQDCATLLLNEIISLCIEGKQVVLDRFGSFSLKYNHPRLKKNPFYGEFISQPSVSFKFKVSRQFQRYLYNRSKSILAYLNEHKDKLDQRKIKEESYDKES